MKNGVPVNKAGLIGALVERAALKKADAVRAMEALFGDGGVIASELKRGERVQITGFGSFQVRKRGARVLRDPRTGKAIQIKPGVALRFRAGAALKESLNRKR